MKRLLGFHHAILLAGLLMQGYVVYFNWTTWTWTWALKAAAFYLWDVSPFFYFSARANQKGLTRVQKVFGVLLLVLHAYFVYLGTQTQRATAGFIFIFTPLYELLLLVVGIWLSDYLGRRPAGS